jgi:hypothetical protein
MKGTIIQIAGIADRVGLFPAQTNRTIPRTSRDLRKLVLILHSLILEVSDAIANLLLA